FGFALSANVTDLRLRVSDESKTPESRELVAALTESRSFRLSVYYLSAEALGKGIDRGNLDAEIVIPYDFARDIARDRTSTVQLLLNAMNANTTAIDQSYAKGMIESYNRTQHTQIERTRSHGSRSVLLQPAFLYNPKLVDSWFIATNIFGLLLIL